MWKSCVRREKRDCFKFTFAAGEYGGVGTCSNNGRAAHTPGKWINMSVNEVRAGARMSTERCIDFKETQMVCQKWE